jgi:hypothetical protein
LVNLLKEQSQKLDYTIKSYGAQIGDIRNLIGGMTHQVEFILQKFSQTGVPIKEKTNILLFNKS